MLILKEAICFFPNQGDVVHYVNLHRMNKKATNIMKTTSNS